MVFDLHNDLMTAVPAEKRTRALASCAGVRGILLAVWTSEIVPTEAGFARYASAEAPFFTATAVEDLGAVATDDYRRFLRRYSPLYASLTWNGKNRLAGGCGCEEPLSDEGVRAVRIMEEEGIALDLAHLSDTAFFDALGRTGRLLVTHTASRALAVHPRNLTDEMARRVAEAGGIIGVAAVPNFLDDSLSYGENCTRATYLKHIAHLSDVIGTEHVAIGTDFFGAGYFPEGMSDYSDFPALAADMEKTGFGRQDIENIFYGNAERFFRIRQGAENE